MVIRGRRMRRCSLHTLQPKTTCWCFVLSHSTDLGFSKSVGGEKLTPHSLNLSVTWKSCPKMNFYLNGDGPVQLTDSLKYTQKYFSPCFPHLCSLRTTYVDPSVSDACLLSDIMELNSPRRAQSIQKQTRADVPVSG